MLATEKIAKLAGPRRIPNDKTGELAGGRIGEIRRHHLHSVGNAGVIDLPRLVGMPNLFPKNNLKKGAESDQSNQSEIGAGKKKNISRQIGGQHRSDGRDRQNRRLPESKVEKLLPGDEKFRVADLRQVAQSEISGHDQGDDPQNRVAGKDKDDSPAGDQTSDD